MFFVIGTVCWQCNTVFGTVTNEESNTLHVIIIPGGSKCEDLFLAPPGAAKHEVERFWRMEMVDMVITRIWFSKSRSVNICSTVRIWDLKNQPGTENQRNNRSQNKAKPSTLGFWFSSGPVPQPGTNGLMTHNHLMHVRVNLEPFNLWAD